MTSLPENLAVILIGRLFHLCIIMPIPTWRLFWFHTQVLTIPLRTVCSMFGVENIHANQEQNLSRRMVSRICPRAVRSRKFQKNSLVASRTCELDRDPQGLLFLHSDCNVLGLSCFASEVYHLLNKKRSWRMTVLTEIEAGTSCVGQNQFWIENAICKRAYTRGLIRIAVNEAHWISQRLVA